MQRSLILTKLPPPVFSDWKTVQNLELLKELKKRNACAHPKSGAGQAALHTVSLRTLRRSQGSGKVSKLLRLHHGAWIQP